MTRPNWFFGFPVAGDFLSELPQPPPAFRRFHAEDLHVTLSFLGACGEEAALRALAALDVALASAPVTALDISLGKVVPMGRKGAYTALSALVEQGCEALSQHILSLRDVLSDAALGRRETRPPKPHVTLLRPRRNASPSARKAGLLWADGVDLHGTPLRLQRIALYTWSEGARRERLFRIFSERALA